MTPPRGLALIALLAVCAAARAAPADRQKIDVTFTDYSPLASNPEMARRMLSPLTVAAIPGLLAKAGRGLRDQPIDLSAERFITYVPAQAPAGGYGLLVFVPPWPEAKAPEAWTAVLDRRGFAFVSAARSGNDENTLARRAPLALLAARNMMNRYPIDPGRIYVAGFSGGSRVAMRLALGYPDLFRGALLNAGSDPIGDPEIPLPPRDLMLKFQNRTRLVYLTGQNDTAHLGMDAVSLASMRDWCMFNIDARIEPNAGHQTAGAAALSQALDELEKPASPDPVRLAACRAGVDRAVKVKLDQARALIARGRKDEAERSIKMVDQHFGGLAAPDSVDLAGP